MRIELHNGDCLEKMKLIEDGSIDLVLCDPPYGTMKGLTGVNHGLSGKTEWDTALEPSAFLAECDRVLRMNGALVLFSQEPYTSRLITEAHDNLPFSYRMTWLKDHFANALVAKKAPVSYSEDVLVFFKDYDTRLAHPLRVYARQILAHCGGQLKSINAKLAHRRAEHFFYVDSTQFGMCSEATYAQLCDAYQIDMLPFFKPYAVLRQEFSKATPPRAFNLPAGKKFKSNVLEYRKDYTGFHPTQKPVALLEDLIATYSSPGDTVLDFTMGSGSTGVACRNTGRDFIGIELDAGYFAIAEQRIREPGAAAQIKAAPPTDHRQLDLLEML